MRRGTKDRSALRRAAVATSRATRGERRVARGRVRIKVCGDIGAAHPACAVGQSKLRWIKPGFGDDRGIARGGTFSGAVDSAESLRLVALYLVERAIGERKACRGSRLSGALATLAVVKGASAGSALKSPPIHRSDEA